MMHSWLLFFCRSACVLDGYDCSGSGPFCSKDYKWCSSSGQCITKQSSCVSASISVPLQTPAPPGNASSAPPQPASSQPPAQPSSLASKAASVVVQASPSVAPQSSASPQNRSVAPQPTPSQAAAYNKTTRVSPSPAATKIPVVSNSSAVPPQISQSHVVDKNTTIAHQTVSSIKPSAAKSSLIKSSSVVMTLVPPLAAPKAKYAIAQWGSYQTYANTLQQAEPSIQSPQKIAIVSLPATPATWYAYYGAKWNRVSNVNATSALVLSPGDKLGYVFELFSQVLSVFFHFSGGILSEKPGKRTKYSIGNKALP
eukprot:Seg2087.2 transcript_id=Seg2087.2/GoldUCD/mRNA.D3Y31 product="hypothetical protein" protein_id=Seg2087.2/GoldUCD/D3Y31